MSKSRVLVVDDSTVMRRLVSEAILRDPDLDVACTASNGKLALERLQQQSIDIVILDVEMPEMDGLTALKEIRKLYPKMPVIMCSTLTTKGGSITLEALAAGASDYITKPTQAANHEEAIAKLAAELLPRIKIHRKLISATPPIAFLKRAVAPASPRRAATAAKVDLVLVGTSTGGPNALAEVIRQLPTDLDVPILIVQHMPPVFTGLLAERLHSLKILPCAEATHGMSVEKGRIYLAPGGRHMELHAQGDGWCIKLTDTPPENSCRPAVDVLFRSAAKNYPGNILAIVLTGMGQDGLRGCEILRERGAQILAQDEASSVVWGMPGYVAQNGLADRVLPLAQVAGEISRRVRSAFPALTTASA